MINFATRQPGGFTSSGEKLVLSPAVLGDWDYPPVKSTQQSYTDDPEELENFEQSVALDHVSSSSHRASPFSNSRTTNDQTTPQENGPSRSTAKSSQRNGHLSPRYFCFINSENNSSEPHGYKTMSLEEWQHQNQSGTSPSYIFISYTRAQFHTKVWDNDNPTAEVLQERHEVVEKHKSLLVKYAIRAAKSANVAAFWIDFEGVRTDEGQSEEEYSEDVYRICDIVRAAHSLVIVLASPLNCQLEHKGEVQIWRTVCLRDWGRRLWTVPEALLAPAEHRINMYYVGLDEPESVAKRNLSSLAYDDADDMQQLIDHYESSVSLTPLQFISLAFGCLQRRNTTMRMAGDVSYALQGLFRQRPRVNKHDSGFQAFAKLSLANDSNRLLERMICLRSVVYNPEWCDIDDVWGAKLWDIDPFCQIANVLDPRTVTLGGARGSTIKWDSLTTVGYQRQSRRKVLAWGGMVLSAFLTIASGVFSFVWLPVVRQLDRYHGAENFNDYLSKLSLAFIGFFGTLFTVGALLTPIVFQSLQKGRIHNPQARFFGVEGKVDLNEVETGLFGASYNRLKWASNPGTAAHGDANSLLRTFTLIDTCTLTATVFRAVEAPAVVMVCGREGGLCRALLCSYDWESETFTRESTIRLSSLVLQRMQPMDRLRFAIVR